MHLEWSGVKEMPQRHDPMIAVLVFFDASISNFSPKYEESQT